MMLDELNNGIRGVLIWVIWFPSSGLGTPALEALASRLVVDGKLKLPR